MAKAILDRYVTDRRRRNEHRRVGLMFTIFGAIIIIVLAFIFRTIILSPALTIKSIKAEGLHYLSSDDVIQLATAREFRKMSWFQSLATPQNVLAWRPGVLEGEPILPAVKKLSLLRNIWQRSLTVVVEEREPYGIWCQQTRTNTDDTQTNADRNASDNVSNSAQEASSTSAVPRDSAYGQRSSAPEGGRCWWFDDEGILFRQALAAEGGTIRVVRDYSERPLQIGMHVLPTEPFVNLSSVFKAMITANVPLGEMRLEDLELQEVTVLPPGLARIYFSLRFSAEDTVSGIEALTERPGLDKLEYVDFRVENKVYYK